jgi:hypothetical protein
MNSVQTGSFNLEVTGYRDVPPSTTQTQLNLGDNGRVLSVSGNVIIPNGVFSAGNAVSVYNNSSSGVSLVTTGTQSIQTCYISSVDTNRGGSSGVNLTLAARGLCTILFLSPNSCVVTGSVS